MQHLYYNPQAVVPAAFYSSNPPPNGGGFFLATYPRLISHSHCQSSPWWLTRHAPLTHLRQGIHNCRLSWDHYRTGNLNHYQKTGVQAHEHVQIHDHNIFSFILIVCYRPSFQSFLSQSSTITKPVLLRLLTSLKSRPIRRSVALIHSLPRYFSLG